MAVATATTATKGGSPDPKHNLQAARQAYYDKISKHDMTPLWEVLKNLVTKEPASKCVPALGKFKEAKQLVLGGSRATGPGAGKPRAPGSVAHHPFAICRDTADSAR
jgi:hypothetical protein